MDDGTGSMESSSIDGRVIGRKHNISLGTNGDFFFSCQEEKLPYAFYISDHELVVDLGTYLQKNKGWLNETLYFQLLVIICLRDL